ncbi:hypothetical protein Aduo_001758 [Ancylostoma duodenale]
MEKIVGKLIVIEVAVYIDDVLVSTHSEETQCGPSRCLEAFRKASLKVKLQKYRVMERTTDFLSQTVDAQGVRTSPGKSIQNIPQLRALLGLAGFYRKFVYHYYRESVYQICECSETTTRLDQFQSTVWLGKHSRESLCHLEDGAFERASAGATGHRKSDR